MTNWDKKLVTSTSLADMRIMAETFLLFFIFEPESGKIKVPCRVGTQVLEQSGLCGQERRLDKKGAFFMRLALRIVENKVREHLIAYAQIQPHLSLLSQAACASALLGPTCHTTP